MKTQKRQKYIDVDAPPTSATVCQLKYDGIWCCATSFPDGRIEYRSRTGQLKRVVENNKIVPIGQYVGELMYGTEWSSDLTRRGRFYLFDCLHLGDIASINHPYSVRYSCLTKLFSANRVPPNWELVRNHDIKWRDRLWAAKIASSEFEGLVYRNPSQLWTDPLHRQKHSLTVDIIITDFLEGKGKNVGKCGTIIGRRIDSKGLPYGPAIHVGGGLSDALRSELWANQRAFRGRIIEVEAKAQFQSGKLRHPNFVRFHPDKS